MEQLLFGRVIMGSTLGFHILFALFGVAIPFLISAVELTGIVRKDADYHLMAKRWSFVMVALFVVGAISGIVVAVLLVILWPKFMLVAGQVVGPGFFMETFAFFIEIAFLCIYAYSWDRFRGKYTHWLTSFPIVVASTASAFLITAVNSWMNHPEGFTYVAGVVSNVHPIVALFNHATFTETSHSIISYYLTAALFFAGMYALFLFRENRRGKKQRGPSPVRIRYYTKALVFLMWISAIGVAGVGVTGDMSARYLAKYQPIKFAAMEDVVHTGGMAPIKIGGLFIGTGDDKLRYDIAIPGMLSFLAYDDIHAVVQGLDQFDPSQWPPLWIHDLFDIMVGVGMLMGVVITVFLGLYYTRRRLALSRTALIVLFVSGFSGFVAVEGGWMLTEIGRIPYVITGVMTIAEAFTTSKQVIEFLFLFPVLYCVLGALTILVIVRHFKNNKLPL